MTNKTNPRGTRRKTAMALLWHQGWNGRAPLRMGWQTMSAQRRQIERCARRMGIAIVADFAGYVDYPGAIGGRLNDLVLMLDQHHVDCLVASRVCVRGIDDDDFIAFAMSLSIRRIDLILCD